MPKNLAKNQAQKEIVSAMVRLNQEGYEVPVNLSELKNLPAIPKTSLPQKIHEITSTSIRSIDPDKYSTRSLNQKFQRARSKFGNNEKSMDLGQNSES